MAVKRKGAAGPAHSIDEVRACAAKRAVEFMESSAKAPMRSHFGSNVAGLNAACGALALLSTDDFVETVKMDRFQEQVTSMRSALMNAIGT